MRTTELVSLVQRVSVSIGQWRNLYLSSYSVYWIHAELSVVDRQCRFRSNAILRIYRIESGRIITLRALFQAQQVLAKFPINGLSALHNVVWFERDLDDFVVDDDDERYRHK